ncbi:MAG: DUF2905 domain-containing protein [Anaerolineae bacterium]|nr:DUF2905 domain-containing protein [Anaerolineae bacterium]MBN8620489.1 DUF2905 domain-containing protein [Anaerolineae bacterium]
MDFHAVGRIMLIGGIALALIGGLLMLLGRIPFFKQLGNLPGDIRVEGQGFSCFVPIVSMILISVILTVILNIIIRLINRP